MYELVDYKSGNVIKTYKNSMTAYKAADKKDIEYGSHRYYVRIAKEEK